MILHFSHIGFTDGRTFMIPFGVGSRRGGSGDRVGHRYHAPGAHVARLPLARLSATKQNTKRLRRVMSRGGAASILAVSAAFAAAAGAEPVPSWSPRGPTSTALGREGGWRQQPRESGSEQAPALQGP